MNKRRIEELKKAINTMICSDDYDYDQLLEISQRLDKLILDEVKKNIYVKNVLRDELTGDFDIIIDKMQMFEKMYDFMRIVDPISKEVLEVNKVLLNKTDKCYNIMKKQLICDNCISIRAYNEDDIMIKMEYCQNKVCMMVSVPISIQEKKLVAELFKDVTNSLYMQNEGSGQKENIFSLIEHMNQLEVRDELTGLYNRRFINERLPVDLFSSSVKNELLSIIFVDLDFFKSVNDTYGYHVGDQILRIFANDLNEHIRSGKDWAARYSGEEFLIFLLNTGSDDALDVAERIRNGVMGKKFIADEKEIYLTCSVGVYTISGGYERSTVDNIIQIVHKNLYKAKAEGMNRVVRSID